MRRFMCIVHVGNHFNYWFLALLSQSTSRTIVSEKIFQSLFSQFQAPQKHQKYVSRVLGLPMSKVVCKTKRIGGGFGGKETRSAFLAAAAAVPSYLLNRPVKIILDRDVDMMITGQRHSFLAKYKVLVSVLKSYHVNTSLWVKIPMRSLYYSILFNSVHVSLFCSILSLYFKKWCN